MEKNQKVKLSPERGEATGPFMGLQKRVIIMTPEAFVDMMKVLNATFSTAGFTMVHMMGQEKGRRDASRGTEALREQGILFSKRQILENVIHQNRVTGWGAPNLQKYDEGNGDVTIRVENNPLAIAWGKSEKSACWYLSGYWKGVVSEALEQESLCSETKCMSKGDPYCEFEIKKGGRGS